jgi:hypothetical protein
MGGRPPCDRPHGGTRARRPDLGRRPAFASRVTVPFRSRVGTVEATGQIFGDMFIKEGRYLEEMHQ